MSKGFMGILAIVVVVLIGIFFLTNEPDAQSADVEEPLAITEDDHTQGPEDAPVTLIEYGDFQCPSCEQAHPIVKDILAEHGQDIRFVYRHFHVTSPRSTTFDASRTAVAAGQQDAFWKMHDLLFNRQSEWGQDPDAPDLFRQYAQELELNMEQFEQDFEAADQRVERDVSSAQQLGVSSTPTFYLNGEEVEEGYNQLPEAVEAELNTDTDSGEAESTQ